jgi:hypothetical protein
VKNENLEREEGVGKRGKGKETRQGKLKERKDNEGRQVDRDKIEKRRTRVKDTVHGEIRAFTLACEYLREFSKKLEMALFGIARGLKEHD